MEISAKKELFMGNILIQDVDPIRVQVFYSFIAIPKCRRINSN